jgi:thioredoxin-related protein
MRNYILALGLVMLTAASSFGQLKAKGAATVSERPPAAFVRDKFDPARNPSDDLKAAIETASKENKRIILDVGGEWCGWCVYMDKFIFQHPELTKLRDENYVWVKINMSEENENVPFLGAYPEISGYPHLFVLDKSGTLLESKDTSALEEDKGYNLARFTAFLQKWAVKRK